MKVVDTKGKLCPAPLIAAKQALRETSAGDSFLILTDNQTSYNNLLRFLKDNKTKFTVAENKGVWEITVNKLTETDNNISAESYCVNTISHFQKGDFVVAISSDKMGEGDVELGRLLIINFIKALKDLDKLPCKILFYNSGVKLAVRSSPVIDILCDLEKMGVEIHLCATCVNHYGLADETGTGILSNMFSIAESMASAGSVIKP